MTSVDRERRPDEPRPRGLFDPDQELQDLPLDELSAMAAAAREFVLHRGRALVELGRRASSDVALLQRVRP
jgi:hypothetical protein